MFDATNSNAIISQSKNILYSFFCISGIYIKFEIIWKETWPSEVICFWNYRLEKADLFICPKSRVSEHLRTVNMLKGSKHCRNLHSSIFVIFFDHSEKKISSNNSFLVVSEIFRVFVNILTPNEKYSPSVKASV